MATTTTASPVAIPPTSIPLPTTPGSSPSKPLPTVTSPSKHIFPASPSPSKAPLPHSPLTSPTISPSYQHNKPKFEPNPHPYAIKTTSTALLARSNSSSHNVSTQRHTYVPPSPSAARPVSPTHNRHNNSSGGSNGGHRYTRSLTGVQDIPVLPPGTLGNGNANSRPLPVPPGSASASTPSLLLESTSPTPPRRTKRSETLPVLPSTPPPPPPAFNLEDLPENPKLWTPAQLSAYLTSALRVRGSEGDSDVRLPDRVAKDVAAFVRQARIGGRAFLRLNEADLEGMGVNKLWRAALLNASRNLRQNILKGRIWPSPGSSSPDPDNSTATAINSDSDLDTKVVDSVYGNPMYASSDSSLSSAGQVEDLVATPFTKAKRSRVKVKERVRHIEERSRSRSASEVSASESEEGGSREREGAKMQRAKRVKSRPLPIPPTHSAPGSATGSPSPSPSARRQLPKPPFSFTDGDESEEPTMEALLAAQSSGTGSWGARAWEEIDAGAGIVTVKHIPGEGAEAATMGRVDGERMRGTISRGTGKERGRGRVVTSIFQGVDADGQGLTREGSGGSEESVPAPAELEKDTAVLEPFEPKSRDAEVQSPLVATTEAQVQSEAASSLDAAVQSPVVLTADVEVQSPIVQTAEAEVQSPVVRTVDVQVQSQGSPEDHDNTEAVIQELEKKLEESKAVIEQFKKRLEGVEKGIEEMEKTEAPVIHAASKPPVTVPDTTVARRPKSRVGVATCLVNRLFRVIGLSSPAVNAEGRREQEMDVGDLPSYVFLVGLGVCAVVLKTLVRRMKRGVR